MVRTEVSVSTIFITCNWQSVSHTQQPEARGSENFSVSYSTVRIHRLISPKAGYSLILSHIEINVIDSGTTQTGTLKGNVRTHCNQTAVSNRTVGPTFC